MDRIAAINAFVRVAQARSFAYAGRALGVSASAVGKSVARLEDSLGARLLHRSTRSVTLTPEGILFLDRAGRILAELEEATREVGRNAGEPRGLLRISVPMVGSLFGRLVAAFRERNADVLIDLDVSNRPVNLIEEGFDLVIRTGRIADTRLMTRHLASFRMVLVASPDYLRAEGEPTLPGDLAAHRCLRMRMPQTGLLQPWPLSPGKDGADPRPSVICNDLATTLAIAGAGQGIALLPQFAVGEAIADGRLVRLLAELVGEEEAFQALWPSRRLVTPKVRAFVDFAAEHLNLLLQN